MPKHTEIQPGHPDQGGWVLCVRGGLLRQRTLAASGMRGPVGLERGTWRGWRRKKGGMSLRWTQDGQNAERKCGVLLETGTLGPRSQDALGVRQVRGWASRSVSTGGATVRLEGDGCALGSGGLVNLASISRMEDTEDRKLEAKADQLKCKRKVSF